MIAHSLEGRCILLVEDELLIALDMESTLADAGCTILGPLSEVDQALDVASHESLDFALLDVNVAGEKVFPIADALSARGIPFVFITGYAASDLPKRYQNRPRISKPFDMQRLVKVLQGLFEATPGSRRRRVPPAARTDPH